MAKVKADDEADAESKRGEFLWKVHGYTSEYIRFADSKAAVVIAISTALIAALFAARCHELCYPSKLSWEKATVGGTLLGFGAMSAFALLGAAVLLASWAVSPRLWKTFVKGVWSRVARGLTPTQPSPPVAGIYWGDVLAHQNENEYWKAISGLTVPQMSEAVAKHVYVLAGIAEAKYHWITWATRCAYAGALLACLVLLGSA